MRSLILNLGFIFLEFLLAVSWIIILTFCFKMDCQLDDVILQPKAWLLTAGFSDLIFDIVVSLLVLFFYKHWVLEAYEASRAFYICCLVFGLFQVIWFAIGSTFFLKLDNCDFEWLVIFAQVILGFAVVRIPVLIIFIVILSMEAF